MEFSEVSMMKPSEVSLNEEKYIPLFKNTCNFDAKALVHVLPIHR